MRTIYAGARRMWQPILPDALISSAWESILAIATDVAALPPHRRTTPAECALLFTYLAQADPSASWDAKANEYLNLAVEQASGMAGHGSPSLFSGVAELGWIMEHVASLGGEDEALPDSGKPLEDEDKDDPVAEVDDLILRRLERDGWEGNYDLIS